MQVTAEILLWIYNRTLAPTPKLLFVLASGHHSDWRDSTGKYNHPAVSTALPLPHVTTLCVFMFRFKHFGLPWLDEDSNHCTKLQPTQPQTNCWGNRCLLNGQKLSLFRRQQNETELLQASFTNGNRPFREQRVRHQLWVANWSPSAALP